jgi:hypothetical protein
MELSYQPQHVVSSRWCFREWFLVEAERRLRFCAPTTEFGIESEQVKIGGIRRATRQDFPRKKRNVSSRRCPQISFMASAGQLGLSARKNCQFAKRARCQAINALAYPNVPTLGLVQTQLDGSYPGHRSNFAGSYTRHLYLCESSIPHSHVNRQYLPAHFPSRLPFPRRQGESDCGPGAACVLGSPQLGPVGSRPVVRRSGQPVDRSPM